MSNIIKVNFITEPTKSNRLEQRIGRVLNSERHKTARWNAYGTLAQAGGRPLGPQHLANHRNVLRQERHNPPAGNHRRVQFLAGARPRRREHPRFLMIY